MVDVCSTDSNNVSRVKKAALWNIEMLVCINHQMT